MSRFFITVALTALLAPLAGAGEPAKTEARKPVVETSTLPRFIGSTPVNAEAEAENPTVVVLPGPPRPATIVVEAPPPPTPAAARPVATPVLKASVARPPEPKPEPKVEAEDHPPVLKRGPKLPEDLEKDAAVYLQRRLGFWSEDDAARLMGEPVRHRVALDDEKKEDGDIYAFTDPTHRYREFELDFDRDTGKLRSVFVYPLKMKWDDCRRLWGARVTTTESADGRRFHSYENRRLDVLVDRTGNVISFGLY